MTPQPSGGFAWVQAAAGIAVVCEPLSHVAPHVFTTRAWRLASADAVGRKEAWDEVATALNVQPSKLVRVHQVHGAAVLVVRANSHDSPPSAADIIVSGDRNAAIAVQAADCVPLLIGDRRIGVVASAHAGWRGLAAGVPQIAVHALAQEFGSQPADLVAAIGPSIGACCYEVGNDVRNAFVHANSNDGDLSRWFLNRPQPTDVNPSMAGLAAPRAAHWFMDGWAIVREQLEAAGVPPDQIHVAALCTASHPSLFCSYRRDGARAGRIAGAIRATVT